MADAASQQPIQDDALVLLGRRSDLLQLQGQADLPPRFLAVFDGGLEATAGDAEIADFDRLLRRHHVVGLDAGLLAAAPGDDARTRRYRDNLGQKLAARRVALLTVLREWEFARQRHDASFLHRGDSVGVEVPCEPTRHTLADWRAAAAHGGLLVEVEVEEAGDRACLLVSGPPRSPLVGARDRRGTLAALLEFACEGAADAPRLRSRWFARNLVQRADATMAELLADCAQRQERESLDRLLGAWRDATARMQADTRALTQLELIVVGTRPVAADDQQRIAGFHDVARTWVMTDRLRVGGDGQTLVRACHVWPDAVASLLARLCLGGKEPGARGLYAWRSFVCGIAADPARVEALRDAETNAILIAADEAPGGLSIARKGPFEPIQGKWLVERDKPAAIDWDAGGGPAAVSRSCGESVWVADHRLAGATLGAQRAKLGKAMLGDAADPERVYSQQYWAQIHRSPGMLRVYGKDKLFKASTGLFQRIPAHLKEWREDVLRARRDLAVEREKLAHAAEEFDRARRFHVALAWRATIAAAVSAYAGFLGLYVLRVLLTFSASTWSTGVTIFALAVAGGWFGAFLPALVERRRGEAAARALAKQLDDVDGLHRKAVEKTHEVFRDAEDVRQTIRITAVQRRTTLLAERAWTIVCKARDAVAREFERRKQLGAKVGQVDELERLASEDRRDWRVASIVRPIYEHGRDMPDRPVWDAAFADVATAFRREWQSRLEVEDPFLTGFLRAAALRQLVRDLADMVGARIEQELLRQAERNCEAAGGSVQPQTWADRIVAAVGFDADHHAMLSVLDDGGAQRTPGAYRLFRRDGELADDVCRRLKGVRQGFAGGAAAVVDGIPLGGFAMLFHEVPLTWRGIGFALDESATQDLPGSGGAA